MLPVDMGDESMRTDTNGDLLAFVGSVDGRPMTWDRYVRTDGHTEDVDPKEDDDAASKTNSHDTNAPQQPATEAFRQPTTLLREEAPQEQTLLRHQLDAQVAQVDHYIRAATHTIYGHGHMIMA
ncbi:hypothetical protein BDN71DRAFT_1437460 [Pleurotus eryngii]|uniref:Uncharacterized protein n=1 Tax=Pleurotus eryngii TaxID=5323 RepID=A0A9P5ZF75_PLEER|nr:hypothetical protein BDN71DRAFT_1437460 [Pleurotus eryngii]